MTMTCPTTMSSSVRSVRRLVRAALLIAALALAAGPFVHPAIARASYDQKYYEWCLRNVGQGKDYCCRKAGGVMRSGECVDPASLPTSTLTAPPPQPTTIIVVPPENIP